MPEKKPVTVSGNRHFFAETVRVIYNETMDAYIARCYAIQFCQCLSFTKKRDSHIGERSLSWCCPTWFDNPAMIQRLWEGTRIRRIKASQWKQKIYQFARISILTLSPLSSKRTTTSQFEPLQTAAHIPNVGAKNFDQGARNEKNVFFVGAACLVGVGEPSVTKSSISRLVFHVRRWSSAHWTCLELQMCFERIVMGGDTGL